MNFDLFEKSTCCVVVVVSGHVSIKAATVTLEPCWLCSLLTGVDSFSMDLRDLNEFIRTDG